MKKNNLWKLAGALALTAVLAGCSSSISQEEATTIALEHAGVAKEDAVSLSVQQEYEDGRDIFEVKFSTQDTEYSYDVAQKDGEIINYNYDSTGTPPAGASEGSSASGTASHTPSTSSSRAISSSAMGARSSVLAPSGMVRVTLIWVPSTSGMKMVPISDT